MPERLRHGRGEGAVGRPTVVQHDGEPPRGRREPGIQRPRVPVARGGALPVSFLLGAGSLAVPPQGVERRGRHLLERRAGGSTWAIPPSPPGACATGGPPPPPKPARFPPAPRM